MAVERRLTEIVGAVGGKLHTARSRNDQVATDMAMFTRAHALRAIEALADLQTVIVQVAEAHLDWPMPGYTHLQRAQPVYLSHHLLAYFWMFRRDAKRFEAVLGLDDRAAAGRRRAGGRELPHRPPAGRVRARLRGRRAELDRRRLQPRLRAGLPQRRRHLRHPPLAAGRGDRAVVLGGVRLRRGARRLGLELVDHAAEEEPGRGRAAAREGAADRRPPGRAARRDARAPADLQQGHAGGQGAPLRHRRHARAVPGGGARDARRDRPSSASAWPRRRPTRCWPRSTSPTCWSSAACRSGSRTGSSPGWCARPSTSGRTLSQLTLEEIKQHADVLDDEFYSVLSQGSWLESKESEGGTKLDRVREQLAHARAALDSSVLKESFYDRPVLDVAPDLLGCVVTHGSTAGVIVETEAYHFTEPACHAYVGVTPRTHVLHGPPGHRLRLPLLRHPRAAQRGLRAGGRRRGRADPGAGAAARAWS